MRWRIPLEYVDSARCCASSRPTLAIAWSTYPFKGCKPYNRPENSTNCRPVKNPYTPSCSAMMPTRRYSSALSLGCSPSNLTSPLDALERPVIMCKTVVFPAPLGPRRPVMPGYMSNETSFTATTLPNHLDTPTTFTVGSARLPEDVCSVLISLCSDNAARGGIQVLRSESNTSQWELCRAVPALEFLALHQI